MKHYRVPPNANAPEFLGKWRPRSRRWLGCVLVALIVTATGFALFRQTAPRRSDLANLHNATAVPARSSDEPSQISPGYVGLQVCADCHAERVEEFRTTRHFLACCTPDPASMPQGFASEHGTYEAREGDLSFEMTRKGVEFFQTAIRSTHAGKEKNTSRIDLVYGAGAGTDEVYFTWQDGRLYELPLVWLHPTRQWAASPFNPHASGNFARPLSPQCLECHNTWFEHRRGTTNEYGTNNFILGVTCERCHGPGAEHVAHHRNHPDSQLARHVIHPGRLSRERQLDLCGQCHSNAIKYRQPAFSYRAGERLDDYFKVLVTRHPEDDHVANQMQYMRASKCFQNSESMTCITCHDPHRPSEKNRADRSRTLCSSCHQPEHCGERDRLPTAVQDNCVGCHMPLVNKIQVSFQTKDDPFIFPVQRCEHKIAVYPAASGAVLLEWYRTQSDDRSRREVGRLSQELGAHWLAEMERFQSEYRFLAAIDACTLALRFDPASTTRERLDQLKQTQARIEVDFFKALDHRANRRYREAIATLNDLLAIKPDLAKAHAELGTLYAIVGDSESAIRHLQAVTEHDPDSPSGESMLGWLAFLKGEHSDALEHYRRADEIEPFNARIHYNTGLVLAKLGRWSEAVETYRKVLSIDPRHAHGCHGLSVALRQSGQPQEALESAVHAAELSGRRDPEILLTLAELYAEVGRYAEAEESARDALHEAQSGHSELAPRILQQLRAIQAHTKKN